MAEQPTLETERLILRPFTVEDAPDVQRLAGDFEVASTTLNVPHPYEDGMAEAWISGHQPGYEEGRLVSFATVRRDDAVLLGVISIGLEPRFDSGELGYWIGRPYWNRGYCTDGVRRVLQYGFDELALNRIHARHLTRNPASGRVMEKVGMKYEGCLRQHVKRWDRYEDLAAYGILRSEFG